MGTPTDDTWPGVSSLPNYKPHKLCYYPPPLRLGEIWPRLLDVPFAESLANLLLQPKAQKRIGADQALRHRYFAELPHKIFELDDGKSWFMENKNIMNLRPFLYRKCALIVKIPKFQFEKSINVRELKGCCEVSVQQNEGHTYRKRK